MYHPTKETTIKHVLIRREELALRQERLRANKKAARKATMERRTADREKAKRDELKAARRIVREQPRRNILLEQAMRGVRPDAHTHGPTGVFRAPFSDRRRPDNREPIVPGQQLTDFQSMRLLHVYRALLREISYLPDEEVRRYAYEFACDTFDRNRFRHSIKKAKGNFEKEPSERRSIAEDCKEARQELSILQRANRGQVVPLIKVFRQAYGRQGHRRFELVEYMRQNPLPFFECDSKSPRPESTKPVHDYSALPVTAAFEALVMAHAEKGSIKPVRQVQPKPPELTTQGAPTSEKRRIKIAHAWVNEVRAKLMPPLPPIEREWLRRLALGQEPWTGMVRRRAGHEAIALSETDGKGRKARPHKFTPRFMRRLYALICSQVPVIAYEEAGEQGELRRPVITWQDIREEELVGPVMPLAEWQSIVAKFEDSED